MRHFSDLTLSCGGLRVLTPNVASEPRLHAASMPATRIHNGGLRMLGLGRQLFPS